MSMQTLYADLLQSASRPDDCAGTIKRKTVKGTAYLYASVRSGAQRVEHYLGPEASDDAQAAAERYRQAEGRARGHRSTVQMLRRSGMLAPPMPIGRIFEVLAKAGLFSRGLVLVGTHAFRFYPLALGVTWPGAAFATNDVDISAASFVDAGDPVDLADVLRAADKSIEMQWHDGHSLPCRFLFGEVSLDVLTRKRRGGVSPVEIAGLGVAGEALPFQEYLTEQTFEAIALHGAGVRVSIPTPARYAAHKLIVSQRRGHRDIKSSKDLQQARSIFDALAHLGNDDEIGDAIEDARGRGRAWKTAIDKGLAAIGAD
jgi:hypothetical protein